jgi:hypothetical protein
MPRTPDTTAPQLPLVEPDIAGALQHKAKPSKRQQEPCDLGLFAARQADLVDLMRHKPSPPLNQSPQQTRPGPIWPPLPMRPATDPVDHTPFKRSPEQWEAYGHSFKETDPQRAIRCYRLANAIRWELAIRARRLH